MPDISYSQSGYPIHEGYARCHNRFWDRLASPGAWLSAAQKIAVAKEVRHAQNCELCKQRKAALSPYQVDGSHDTASNELPPAMIEVVHFIVTDPGRLSKKWFEDLTSQGVSVEEYVEILGTIVHTLVIDEFCRGLDIPLHRLPAAKAGESSAYRPASASTDDGAWVPMLPPVIDEGPEADLWDAGANVARAMSLVPDEVRTLMDTISSHYIPYESVVGDWTICPNGGLNRIQMEVVAARVSSYNECFY